MRKLVNVRIPLVLAVSLIVGILVGYLFSYFKISLFWIIAVIPVTAVIIILCARFGKNYFKTVIVIAIALLLVLGTVNSFFRLAAFSNSKIDDGNIYTISARVCEKGFTSTGEYVILKNISADGEKIGGKMIVFLGENYGYFCDVGYKVSFTSEIEVKRAFIYGRLNYYVKDDIRYSCFINGGMTAKYGFSLFGSIRSHIRNTLYDVLDKDTAAIAFAMLTGNTQGIDEGTLTAFRYGGVAHIFAVSGLHIGILYGLLSFIFKKLRINKYAKTALCILPLLFYTAVCGFTLSSVRALIMCCVAAFTKLIHTKYDPLNSLAFSVIIILTIMPISLFSTGFKLSVCATACILLLSKNIARSIKILPKKVSSTIGVALSAQAGTLPVMLADFGYISGAGLLMNIAVIPLLSVAYVVLFASTLICAIIPALAVILPFTTLPLQLIISLFMNASLENALLSGFGAGAFIPAYYLALIMLSDKINLKLLYRASAIILCVVFMCSYVVLNILAPFTGFKIVVSAYYGGGAVIIKSKDGNVLIVTENMSSSAISTLLDDYYANNLSGVIILGGENCVFAYDEFYLNCPDVYVCNMYFPAQPSSNYVIHYERNFTVSGIDFVFEDGYSVIADCDGMKVAVCAGDVVPFESCDWLISDNLATDCNFTYQVGFNEQSLKNNVYDCGNFVFRVKDGEIKSK